MSPQAIAKTIRTVRRVAATAVPLAIVCVLMLAAPARAWEFDISGPTVAFRDDSDIWLYNLDTRQYRQATATPEDYSEQLPAIAGQRVFFFREATNDLLDSFDISSGLLEPGVLEYDWLGLGSYTGDSRYLVYAASQSTGFSPQAVYVLDAAGASPPERISPTEPESLLTPSEGRCVRHPDIDYPWVVWTDVDRLDCNQSPGWLYAMNLETGALQTVATPGGCPTCSKEVSDGKVALVEPEDGHRVLVTYDLADGTRTVHSTPTEPNYGIKDFRGSRIVYSTGSPHIYDLTTGQSTPVPSPTDDESPYSSVGRLSGDWIVYPAKSDARLVARNLQSGEKRIIRPRPNDRDGDGFGDADDQCPDAAGIPPNGCPASDASAPAPPLPGPGPVDVTPDRQFTVRAIGDSVTAGFGYNASGKPVGLGRFLSTCVLFSSSDHCQSPDVVAYPAVWMRSAGLPLRYPSFANYAMTGSTPEDWIEPNGPFHAKLDQVVADDPDVVLATLGGNPLLTDFAFGLLEHVCMLEVTGEQVRFCLQHKLVKYKTVPRLTRIYDRLLDATDATVGVFLYHKTYPKTVTHKKADILFSELNSAIATAFTKARMQRAGQAGRLKLLKPPSFDAHECGSPQPWVLSIDTCIHPNAAGQRAYARVITAHLFPNGLP